jgi:hypothetical protein
MSNQSTTSVPLVTSIALASLLTIPAYLVKKADPETGEIIHVPKYKYIIGAPKQYRFNGQNGQFNINGEQILLDTKGKAIDSFSFQPIAWRIFEENLFARGRKETWAELFFVDAKDCISSIMVNNTTLEELRKLAENLFYDDITLADIVLTIKPEKAENEREGQKRSWYIGRFSYQLADPAKVKEFKEYARDYPIYRRDTLTLTAVYIAKSDTYYIPMEAPAEIEESLSEATSQAA